MGTGAEAVIHPPARGAVLGAEEGHGVAVPKVDLEVLTDPAAKLEAEDGPPINLALVLDCSTSMQGARMDMVKATAADLIRQLRPQDVFSLVAFNDRATTIIPAGSQHKYQMLESSIRKLDASGGTEIFKGLEAGFKEVQRHRKPSYTNHIILITDGHTYGDETKCLELADQAAALGIGISGLGIGTDWNDDFIDELSMRTGGSSIYVSKPKDIHKLLKEAFQSLGRAYVERVNLDLRMVPGVHLQYAFRLVPDAGVLNTNPPLILGNIPQKSRQRVLLEFLIDPIATKIEHIILAEGRFTFDIPKHSSSSYRIPLTLLRPVSEMPTVEPPPQIIVDAMSKLTLYRMQEKAHEALTAGNVEQAAKNLKNLATHLLSKGEQALAKTVILEAQNLENQQKFSQNGEKEIKYGTRALLLPSGSMEENNL